MDNTTTDKRALRRVSATFVPRHMVSRDRVELAQKHAAAAAKVLGVPTPRLAFYVGGPSHKDGWYIGSVRDAIYLRAALVQAAPEVDVASVVAHELRHLADHRLDRLGYDKAADERRANAFALKFAHGYPAPRTGERQGARGSARAPARVGPPTRLRAVPNALDDVDALAHHRRGSRRITWTKAAAQWVRK